MNVLLIEDEYILAKSICLYLEKLGFEVTTAEDGLVALETISSQSFNLFIIDINLPNINGIDILKEIRKTASSPVIMMTAYSTPSNLEQAYKNGCSDFVKKPFEPKELELKIERLLNLPAKNIFLSDNIKYDTKNKRLYINKEYVHLRKKESRLLEILVENLGKVISYDKLNEFIWEGEIRESYPLRQLVNELKKKLPSGCIENTTHHGYVLNVS